MPALKSSDVSLNDVAAALEEQFTDMMPLSQQLDCKIVSFVLV